MIRKRHFCLTEEMLKENPELCTYDGPSLRSRQEMLSMEVPKLGKEAALKAIEEWGQQASRITHLIFATMPSQEMPGADYRLAGLLGLEPSVQRYVFYFVGCFVGGTVLHLAKDIAENNPGARVLVVCSEISAAHFRAPTETHLDMVTGQSLFSDGAAAVIIAADPDPMEAPLFEMVSAKQTTIPETDNRIRADLTEMGFTYDLKPDVPVCIGRSIEKCMKEAFGPLGVDDWNSLFYAVHPGGRAIVDQLEINLRLTEDKMAATRHVLKEFGNTAGPCVLFVLDEVRNLSVKQGRSTTGTGLQWGVLIALGPGLTAETIVLRSFPTHGNTY